MRNQKVIIIVESHNKKKAKGIPVAFTVNVSDIGIKNTITRILSLEYHYFIIANFTLFNEHTRFTVIKFIKKLLMNNVVFVDLTLCS